MARGLTHSVPIVAAAAALLVAAGLAGSAGGARTSAVADVPKGGTLRIGAANVDFVDPALGYWRDAWLIQDATCARLFANRHSADAGGWRVTPEVVDRYTVSRDGRVYVLTLKKTFRFHTGARVTAQSFADAFNRNARLRSPRSPAAVYMREIVGAAAVSEDKARSISGIRVLDRYRLQIRLTKPVGDFTARLTMPFFCPILPNTPVDEGNRQPGRLGPVLRRRAHREPAHRAEAKSVLPRRAAGERRPDGRGRPERASRRACSPSKRTGSTSAANRAPPGTSWRALAEKYGINRRDGQLFVGPSLATWALAFNHDRPAFRGPGQIPLKKAINFAIDRPAMVRPFGYLGGKRTDQMLPPALGRPASIYPLGGADVVAARRWYARARIRPSKLVFYTSNTPAARRGRGDPRVQPQADRHRPRGEVLLDSTSLAEKAATPGEPFDLVLVGWGVDYADAAAFFVPLLLGTGTRSARASTSTIRASSGASTQRTA